VNYPIKDKTRFEVCLPLANTVRVPPPLSPFPSPFHPLPFTTARRVPWTG